MSEFYEDLTPKEKQIYCKLVNNIEGKTVIEMAEDIGISSRTFNTHILHIFQKTGASSQVELIVKHYHRRGNLWKQQKKEL